MLPFILGLVEHVVTNGLEYSNVDLILLARTGSSSSVCACQNISNVSRWCPNEYWK